MPIFFLLGGKALFAVSAKTAGTKIVVGVLTGAATFITEFMLN